MKADAAGVLYSAKDLINFLGCEHSSALDMKASSGALSAPDDAEDPYLELLKQKGNEHERSYLEALKAEGKRVVEIARVESPDGIDVMTAATRQAMRDGVDVIYQGALRGGQWHGYSDFLLRTPVSSQLGDWSYEVADTKLARTARPKHVVQLCVYSELVALEQGVMPTSAYVVLGDGSKVTLRLDDYRHYVDAARERFEQFCRGTHETTAEPCSHCDLCRWSKRCEEEWENADHLQLVARLARPQAHKLRAAGVTNLRELAVLERPIAKMQAETLERLSAQARLQHEKRSSGVNLVETLPLEPLRGFARLPQKNDGDLFFDMEGDPVYSAEGSLEYLFGFHHFDAGVDKFTAFWARDRASEKQAFEDALDFITARLKQYPDAFVYHYASYEATALKRLARQYGTRPKEQVEALKLLAQQYGTRENEVDDLLRNRKLVDLYKVVREGIRISEPSYSLKNLEVFYAPRRTEAITSGGDSIVAFERWLLTGDDTLLRQIEEYNAFDCRSTRMCRDWLLTLRPDDTAWFDPAAEISAEEVEKEKKRRQEDAMYLATREGLLENSPDDPAEHAWRSLLGHLLEYHRREARSEWWEYFKRLGSSVEQLVEDNECIGGLTVDTTVKPRSDKQSYIWRLRFPEQEFKLDVDKKVVRQDTGKGAGSIVEINEAEGWLELRAGKRQPAFPEVVNLIPQGPRGDDVMRVAIAQYALKVIAGQEDEYPAITGLLRRARPRVSLTGGAENAPAAEKLDHGGGAENVVAVVKGMRDTHLVIQGPPGSGKTFTSAHAIVALLQDGKRVGVASFTHKAINNLLAEVERVAAGRGVTFTGVKRYSEDDQRLNGAVIEDTTENDDVVGGSHQIIGGTAWLFARPDMVGKLDYLFIDEAGQVSLANVVAIARSAKNIVLVGDQMQLTQPTKGAHPGGSGVSALDYLMEGRATVPGDLGIFLANTWRMHPDVCRFISDAFYESRLQSAPPTVQQKLVLTEPHDGALAATGLRFVAVDHVDNGQRSVQEAERLNDIYRSLLGQRWVNQKGETRALGLEDILVVSPYNMQVNLLERVLPDGARVGTVDRFQGQEAAVVLISMAASSGERVPRGIEFLFSPNRLNVAISRARCLSAVLASPLLPGVSCRTVEQMRLANVMCWIARHA